MLLPRAPVRRAADYLAKATEQVFTEHPDAVILTSPASER